MVEDLTVSSSDVGARRRQSDAGVGERRKLLIFMNVSFSSIDRARRVHRGPAVEAYRDHGKLATLTSGQNKKGTPVGPTVMYGALGIGVWRDR